jgi:hypothetical protein
MTSYAQELRNRLSDLHWGTIFFHLPAAEITGIIDSAWGSLTGFT